MPEAGRTVKRIPMRESIARGPDGSRRGAGGLSVGGGHRGLARQEVPLRLRLGARCQRHSAAPDHQLTRLFQGGRWACAMEHSGAAFQCVTFPKLARPVEVSRGDGPPYCRIQVWFH